MTDQIKNITSSFSVLCLNSLSNQNSINGKEIEFFDGKPEDKSLLVYSGLSVASTGISIAAVSSAAPVYNARSHSYYYNRGVNDILKTDKCLPYEVFLSGSLNDALTEAATKLKRAKDIRDTLKTNEKQKKYEYSMERKGGGRNEQSKAEFEFSVFADCTPSVVKSCKMKLVIKDSNSFCVADVRKSNCSIVLTKEDFCPVRVTKKGATKAYFDTFLKEEKRHNCRVADGYNCKMNVYKGRCNLTAADICTTRGVGDNCKTHSTTNCTAGSYDSCNIYGAKCTKSFYNNCDVLHPVYPPTCSVTEVAVGQLIYHLHLFSVCTLILFL